MEQYEQEATRALQENPLYRALVKAGLTIEPRYERKQLAWFALSSTNQWGPFNSPVEALTSAVLSLRQQAQQSKEPTRL
jgi:hypothetical protein